MPDSTISACATLRRLSEPERQRGTVPSGALAVRPSEPERQRGAVLASARGVCAPTPVGCAPGSARASPARTLAALTLALAIAPAFTVGCNSSFGPKAKYGITFYCPGAGNVDLGDAGLREGFEAAGYRGEVASLMWTMSFNPAIDQVVRFNAHLGAMRLAGIIQDYLDRYPGHEVNVVGLSAGTGVAIWALEHMNAGYKVQNVVLLGSSLSSTYDVSPALKHVQGTIYCYYSANDAVLAGPMKVFGTIDAQFMTDGAGAVGLKPSRDRVVNIAWKREYAQYGYYGGHTDGTSPEFVRKYLAPYVMEGARPAPTETRPANRLATDLPAGPGD